jgi:hypothetical protein
MARLPSARGAQIGDSWERELRRSLRVWEAIGRLESLVKVLTWRLEQQEARCERLIEQVARASYRIDAAEEQSKSARRGAMCSRKNKSRRRDRTRVTRSLP